MCHFSKFLTLVLWIWCKRGLAVSYEYFHSSLLECKWGWGIEFHRPNEACIFLTTNERCSEIHWFSIILPKAPNAIQLAFRCSTDALTSLRITPIGKNASRTLQRKVWNAWMMHFHQHAKLCVFQANSLDLATLWRYNSSCVDRCLGSTRCYGSYFARFKSNEVTTICVKVEIIKPYTYTHVQYVPTCMLSMEKHLCMFWYNHIS